MPLPLTNRGWAVATLAGMVAGLLLGGALLDPDERVTWHGIEQVAP